ncbi:unnamed protein product, partial [Sphagnum tenellum]
EEKKEHSARESSSDRLKKKAAAAKKTLAQEEESFRKAFENLGTQAKSERVIPKGSLADLTGHKTMGVKSKLLTKKQSNLKATKTPKKVRIHRRQLQIQRTKEYYEGKIFFSPPPVQKLSCSRPFQLGPANRLAKGEREREREERKRERREKEREKIEKERERER